MSELEPEEVFGQGLLDAQACDEPVIRVYASRWHMLAMFSSVCFANAFLWTSFAPISDDSKVYFDITDTCVNLLAMSYMILYLPGSLACAVLIHKLGLRGGLIAGAAINLAGTAIRYGSTVLAPGGASYAVLLLGTWFPANEQNIALAIAALVSPLGNASGQVIPSTLVSCSSHPCQHQDISGMGPLLLSQLVLSLGAAAWLWAGFRSRPPHAPSEAAHEASVKYKQDPEHRATEPSVTQLVLGCCSDGQFMLLATSFGLGFGVFSAVLTVDEQLIRPVFQVPDPAVPGEPTSYSLDQDGAQTYSGVYGAVLIGTGLVSSAVVGPLLDRLHCYKAVLKSGLTMILASVIALVLTLRPGSTWHCYLGVAFAMLGGSMVPILPTALEAGVECTYPIPEEYSSGVLMTIGQFFGIAFTLVMPPLIDMEPNWYSAPSQFTPVAILVLSTAVVGAGFMFMFDGEYKRLGAEKAIVASRSQCSSFVDSVACSDPEETHDDIDQCAT